MFLHTSECLLSMLSWYRRCFMIRRSGSYPVCHLISAPSLFHIKVRLHGASGRTATHTQICEMHLYDFSASERAVLTVFLRLVVSIQHRGDAVAMVTGTEGDVVAVRVVEDNWR